MSTRQRARTLVSFQDLTGVGRCALMVAIPVISAMGVQVIPAPTAVLSAHTAYPDYTVCDLTDFLEVCTGKWAGMGLTFDCVYTGYLASVRQVELARSFMERQPGALRVVDPVMGDDGSMYRGMPEEMPERMRLLCRDADVITPNLTETALLTGLPYERGVYTEAMLAERLHSLMALGPRRAVITGARTEQGHANVWMDERGIVQRCGYEAVPAEFPGTGDLFASALSGALTRGDGFAQALRLATDYVKYTMQVSIECGAQPLEGVQLEKTLGMLV